MSYTVPVVNDHFTAIEARLAEGPVAVRRGAKPDGAGWQGAPGASAFVPYMILDPIPGGVTHGTAGDPQADASLPFDVRCIGSTADQAQQVADLAMRLLCKDRQAIQIPGRDLLLPVSIEMAGSAREDLSMGDGQPLFISAPRFRIHTTPKRSES